MSVLVKSCFDTVKRFNRKGVVTKVGNKKHQVFFKVYCDDTNLEDCISLYKRSSNIVMLEYQGVPMKLSMIDLTNVYITMTYEYGMDVSMADIERVCEEVPEGVTPIIKLPIEFKDMQFICEVASLHPEVRFCGGTLFCFNDCKIGCCGRDILDKRGIAYPKEEFIHEGCCCALSTMSEEEVELEEGIIKSKGNKSSSGGGKKKKTLMFHDLLYQNGTSGL